MAVTNNVLNAINVFSSTSVFNSNKSSVGANDLNFIKQTTAELATEGGGIIAQSLGANGYVKFANGLILQWGYLTSSSITFPVTFTTRYVYVIGDYRNGATTSGQYHYVSAFTNSQLQASNLDGSQTKYFVVLGE